VILPDGRIAESRAAPRSATGPDLDHLALGGEGSLYVIAGAVIRLFPASPPCDASFRLPSLAGAVDAVARLCRDRLEPICAVARRAGDGALLSCAWGGASSGPLHRQRAIRALERTGGVAAVEGEQVVEAAAGSGRLEVDATWESLGQVARQGSTDAFELVGLHAGGAFAALASGDEMETSAARLHVPGLRIIEPGRLRDAAPGWESMGAAALWERLSAAVGTP